MHTINNKQTTQKSNNKQCTTVNEWMNECYKMVFPPITIISSWNMHPTSFICPSLFIFLFFSLKHILITAHHHFMPPSSSLSLSSGLLLLCKCASWNNGENLSRINTHGVHLQINTQSSAGLCIKHELLHRKAKSLLALLSVCSPFRQWGRLPTMHCRNTL